MQISRRAFISAAGAKGCELAIGGEQPPDRSWHYDPQILAFYQADCGLQNQIGPYPALSEVGGAVEIGKGLDHRPVYRLRKSSGGYLLAPIPAQYGVFYGPVHLFVLARAAAAGAINDTWAGSNFCRVGWGAAGAVRFISNVAVNLAADPFSYHLLEFYGHVSESRLSIDGAPYLKTNMRAPQFNGIALGAHPTGINRADADVAAVLAVEGQASDELKQAFWSYLTQRYPSLSLTGPAPSFSVSSAAEGWPDPPFDIIAGGGQSNNSNPSTGGTLTPSPLAYQLGNDNRCGPLQLRYDDPTNQVDRVSEDSTAIGTYGNAIALCNTYAAASGRPVVFVPGALGGSNVVPGAGLPSSPSFSWDPSYPRGRMLRNCLPGSLAARIADAVSKGGTFRFLLWYQGEQEATALNPRLGEAWPAATQACLAAIADKAGVPLRAVVAQLCSIVPGEGPSQYPNWTRFRNDIQPLVTVPDQILFLPGSDGPMEPGTHQIHLAAAASDDIGERAAELAISQGWI